MLAVRSSLGITRLDGALEPPEVRLHGALEATVLEPLPLGALDCA